MYITNACVLPSDLTVEKLLGHHRSRPYNPDIANTFFRAGYIESWGRGVQKICEACKALGTSAPEYEVLDRDITLKLIAFKPAKEIAVNNQSSGTNVSENVPDVPKNVPVTEAVLAMIKEDSSLTTPKMAEIIGVSRKTIQRAINELKATGTICREGSNRNGRWIVK